jgi:LysM repeat protein
MKMKALIAAVVLSISTITASASVYKLPTTTIDGKEYYYHEVKAKETLYSLSHKLGMSQDEMKKYNPSLAEGLKVGAKLYFPVDELGGGDVQIIHKVEKGETVYGISKQYHITIEQLLQLNPSAQDGIKVGDELKIKKMVDL